MEIIVKRVELTDESSISEWSIDGKFECYGIEDKDRGLLSSMSESEIKALKIYGKTAIPKGTYQVVLSFSNRFKKYLPELLNVKGYAGVRIHPGNTAADSEGCLLPGTTKAKNFVGNSVKAFNTLFAKMKTVEKKEKIFITIK
jgi:hypothetical protein